jgi:flagellin-specific chaperone FliS
MAQRTLNIIEKAKRQLNTDNRSEIVKTMVDISDMVIKALSEGGTVIIESKDGTRNKIVIPGISK